MPLSEHEQRQLEQIERALYAEDPKFAQAVRAKDPRVHYKRRVVEAAIGFLLGVGLLLAGVDIQAHRGRRGWLRRHAGLLDVGAVQLAAHVRWRDGRARPGPGAPGTAGPAPGSRTRFMERLEERWRRRQERGQ